MCLVPNKVDAGEESAKVQEVGVEENCPWLKRILENGVGDVCGD